MKKLCFVLIVFSLLVFVSCGGNSNKDNSTDKTDSGDTVTDGDGDSGDSGSTDNDPSDSWHENPDTAPDGGDTAPDDGDSAPDSGDTQSNDDDPDTTNENPDNLPECSPTSVTPCIDSEAVNSVPEKTNLIWSGKSPERLRWIDAVDYCKNLKEGGYSDWQLPTLAALGTLVRTCGSDGYSDGKCSKFGDIVFLWSSSTNGTAESQGVFFYNGGTQSKNVDETFDLRCVRRDFETRKVNCKGFPEQHAEWNTVSQITQTWNWYNVLWLPSQTSIYSEEEPSTEECRFKCEENYLFDSDSNQCSNPCYPNPCDEVANSTKLCTALAWNEYICGCVSGYHWWGVETGCYDKKSIGNICTGQTTCYSNSSAIACPTSESEYYFGQDAYYASLGKCTPQSFTVQTISSEKVVLDNNTGLMWQQTIPTEEYTWEDALSYCDDLTYAGYSDWRLPTPQELLTIIDNSRYDPAIDTTYFPDTPSETFWSSSTVETNGVWGVSFSKGSSHNSYSKNSTGYPSLLNVRCVRGTTLPTSSFISSTVNGDVIVTDVTTGLVWKKSNVNDKDWYRALSYCESLTYAGYSDWRLPNKNELASLVNYAKSEPASNCPDIFGGLVGNYDVLLSSSTNAEGDYKGGNFPFMDSAWGLNPLGQVTLSTWNVRIDKSHYNNVTCVRNAE